MAVDGMEFGTNIVPAEYLPLPTRTTWMGYRNETGPAATRNLLGMVTTCAAPASWPAALACRRRSEWADRMDEPYEGRFLKR